MTIKELIASINKNNYISCYGINFTLLDNDIVKITNDNYTLDTDFISFKNKSFEKYKDFSNYSIKKIEVLIDKNSTIKNVNYILKIIITSSHDTEVQTSFNAKVHLI
jgi:hypothetical protein